MRTYILADGDILPIIKWAYRLVEHNEMRVREISIKFDSKYSRYKAVVRTEDGNGQAS